jgi:hypothetical protein
MVTAAMVSAAAVSPAQPGKPQELGRAQCEGQQLGSHRCSLQASTGILAWSATCSGVYRKLGLTGVVDCTLTAWALLGCCHLQVHPEHLRHLRRGTLRGPGLAVCQHCKGLLLSTSQRTEQQHSLHDTGWHMSPTNAVQVHQGQRSIGFGTAAPCCHAPFMLPDKQPDLGFRLTKTDIQR